jgi:hypothetical protein
MGRKARRTVGGQAEAESKSERERSERYAGQIEDVAGQHLRGEYTPGLAAAQGAYRNLEEDIRRRAATTGDRQAYAPAMMEAARMGERALKTASKEQVRAGAGMLQGLYGPSMAYRAALWGPRASMANQPGFWDQFAGDLARGAGTAIAGFA